MGFVAIFETATIALFIPISDILTTGQESAYFRFLKPLFGGSNIVSKDQILIVLSISLLIVFLVKALIASLLLSAQSSFIFNLKNEVSSNLFIKYLYSSYTFHKEKNSSILLRNLTLETGELIGRFVQPLTILLTDIFLFLFIAILLFVNDPLSFMLIFGILSITVILFIHLTRNLSSTWGAKRQKADGLRIKSAQEALVGITDLNIYSLHNFYKDQYSKHMKDTTSAEAHQFFLSQIPKPILELFAVLGLLLIVVSNYFFSKQFTDLVPTLVLYCAAIFKIIPSINRILYSLQNIRFSGPVLKLFSSELTSKVPEVELAQIKKIAPFNETLKLRNVTYKYPNSDRNILENINISIKKNTSVAIVGESGSGKTTLVNLILGLITPSAGEIYADDIKIEHVSNIYQCNFGYVPQKIFIADDTLENNIALGVSEIDSKALNEAIDSANLRNVVNRLPKKEQTIIGENGSRLSGGEMQRVGIARALYFNSEVLIFDEATSALDDKTEKEIVRAIEILKKSKTVIIIAHRQSSVENCNQKIVVSGGRILVRGEKV